MRYFVYRTTNTVNGRYYIGCHRTENVNDNYLGSGKFLLNAVRKHGVQNFKREILFEFQTPEEMFAKEKELVEIGPYSYNLKEGGIGGFDPAIHKNRSSIGGKRSGSENVLLKRGIFSASPERLKEWGSKGGKKGGLRGNRRGKKKTLEERNKIRLGMLSYRRLKSEESRGTQNSVAANGRPEQSED